MVSFSTVATVVLLCIAIWILYDQRKPLKESFITLRKKTIKVNVTDHGLFQYHGCTMLTLEEFAEGRLASAPFLTIPVSAPTFSEVMKLAKKYIQIVGAGETYRLLDSLQKGTAQKSKPSLVSDFLSPVSRSSSQGPKHNGLFPYDYPSDRLEREKTLQHNGTVESFMNLPEATKLKPQGFEFYGPVYLFAANHPDVVPPLQDRGVAPPPPDPTIPPADQDDDENANDDNKKPIEVPPADLDNGKPYVYAILYFPSMTRDGRPAPNYEFLGRCHRWMFRLMEARQYRSSHKQCQNSCFGTPTWKTKAKKRRFTQYYNQYVTPCGIHRAIPDPLPENRSSKYEYFFGVYSLKLDHPDVYTLFSKESPRHLLRSIMPMGAEWATHCMNALVSPNNKFFLALRPNTFGIYENLGNEDIADLCRRGRVPKAAKLKSGVNFPGYNATRMEVSDEMLFIYGVRVIRYKKRGKWRYGLGAEEEILRELPLASQSAERPLALVIGNDGSLTVYDRFNKKVTDDRLLDLMYQPINDQTPQSAYDRNADYRYRIEQLKAYLRLIKVMQMEDVAPMAQDADIISLLGGISEQSEYNQKIDYVDRFRQLIQYLQMLGIDIPAALIPTEDQHQQVMTADDTMSETSELTTYEQKQEVMNRVLELAAAMGVDPAVYFAENAALHT